MQKHFNTLITGKVQGVFFRASAKQKADELGLNGFVRNEKNNKVYLEVEGKEAAIKKFIDWCHIGPPDSLVERVEITESPLKNFWGFEIIRKY